MGKMRKISNKIWKKGVVWLLCFLFISGFAPSYEVNAQTDAHEAAKQAIVEIYSGFMTGEGDYHRMKNASGFLIYNEENAAYAVTTYNTLINTEKEKAAYMKKKNMDTDGYSMGDSIRVVVQGDVTIEASIVTKSEKENFAVLRLDSSLKEKTVLKLGSSSDMAIGDPVYAMGFAKDANKEKNNTEFLAADVEIIEGKMQDNAMEKGGATFIQHSATVHKGNTGGPLLDENGYVIGMNNAALNDDEPIIFFSLPVEAIREILDNFELAYTSEEEFHSSEEFNNLLKECTALLKDETYKAASKASLTSAVEYATQILTQGGEDGDMAKAIEQLKAGKDSLEKKMETTKKVIIVLGGILLFLLIRFVLLLVWRNGHKDVLTKADKGTVIGNEEKVKIKTQEPEDSLIEELEEVVPKYTKGALRFERTGQMIDINKDEFTIGKKAGNDFVIEDNIAISRKHACIEKIDGVYYIKDVGSANGTYVNGVRVEEGDCKALKNGDGIGIADEKFVFLWQ